MVDKQACNGCNEQAGNLGPAHTGLTRKGDPCLYTACAIATNEVMHCRQCLNLSRQIKTF